MIPNFSPLPRIEFATLPTLQPGAIVEISAERCLKGRVRRRGGYWPAAGEAEEGAPFCPAAGEAELPPSAPCSAAGEADPFPPGSGEAVGSEGAEGTAPPPGLPKTGWSPPPEGSPPKGLPPKGLPPF